MIENLRILNLKPQICFRDNICDPINLYHKVGHGKLDMYVLNPSKESREVKEFLNRWGDDMGHLGKFKSGINVDGKELWLPIANLVSICALLIWQPANPNDTITRLLFPGSTPQNKIFKGLEKLRKLECLKYPTCSYNSLQESATDESYSKKKRAHKSQPDNSIAVKREKQDKIAKRRNDKLRKDKEEHDRQEKEKREKEKKEEKEKREKIRKEEKEKREKEKKEEKDKKDKEKEEQDKMDKEGKEKERQDKIERKKKQDKEKEEQEKSEKERKEKEKIKEKRNLKIKKKK